MVASASPDVSPETWRPGQADGPGAGWQGGSRICRCWGPGDGKFAVEPMMGFYMTYNYMMDDKSWCRAHLCNAVNQSIKLLLVLRMVCTATTHSSIPYRIGMIAN